MGARSPALSRRCQGTHIVHRYLGVRRPSDGTDDVIPEVCWESMPGICVPVSLFPLSEIPLFRGACSSIHVRTRSSPSRWFVDAQSTIVVVTVFEWNFRLSRDGIAPIGGFRLVVFNRTFCAFEKFRPFERISNLRVQVRSNARNAF